MTRWVGHSIFAVILAASIAVNAHTSDIVMAGDIAARDAIVPAVLSLTRSYDMALERQTRVADVTILIFRAPGCARPLLIAPLYVSLDRAPLVPTFGGADYTVRYVYLDRAWSQPDRLALIIEWKTHKLLGALGLSRFVPSPYVLLIDAPTDCRTVGAIDWPLVWDRKYVARLDVGGIASHL